MVLTTPNGLYRYRLGDVVRVVDFYNQCPIVEFLYRYVGKCRFERSSFGLDLY